MFKGLGYLLIRLDYNALKVGYSSLSIHVIFGGSQDLCPKAKSNSAVSFLSKLFEHHSSSPRSSCHAQSVKMVRTASHHMLLSPHLLITLPTQARNSEKAQSMLFRFRAQQAASLGIVDAGRTRRPRLITEVTSIPTCEKWRGQVLKEISRKVSKIQEQSLSDFQIRDLNDEINKAMREKHMWEVQIRNLGGPNYMRGGGRVYDEDGKEIPGGGKGYR